MVTPTLTTALRLSPAAGDPAPSVRRFGVREAISTLFRIVLEVRSPREDLDLRGVVGQPATFLAELASGARTWSGVIAEGRQLALEPDGLSTYELVLVPALWLLGRRSGHRIFQHTSVPEIVEQLFVEHHIEAAWRNAMTHPRLEQRVQYGESDLAFVFRLLEEAGISFFFAADPALGSRLVLTDTPASEAAWGPIRFVASGALPAPAALPAVLDGPRRRRTFRRLHLFEIVERVLEGAGLALTGRPRRDLASRRLDEVIQDETDLAFLRRLLDPERLELSRAGAGLALTERGAVSPLPIGHVTRVRCRREVAPDRVVVRDFDMRTQRAVDSRAAKDQGATLEQSRYEPGALLVERPGPAQDPLGDDQGVARIDEGEGSARAARALAAARAGARRLTFETDVIPIAPGVVFSMSDHPRADLGAEQRWLVTGMEIDADVHGRWSARGAAVPADVPWAPARITPRPRIAGVQSAIVVGAPGEEIHVDEHGRVRVQFPWNRAGADDRGVSCWVRVSQTWAGPGYGLFTVPRVGHEVLVAFIGGDPDQPVVVGRVHDTLAPAPYPLPASAAVSAWRTRSTAGGAHEIRLDDTAGREHLYVQSERDFVSLARGDESERTEKDRVDLVRGDDTLGIAGHRRRWVGNTDVETTQKDRLVDIGRERRAAVGERDTVRAGRKIAMTVVPALASSLPAQVRERVAAHLDPLVERPEAPLGLIPTMPFGGAKVDRKHWRGSLKELHEELPKPFVDLNVATRGSVASDTPASEKAAASLVMTDDRIVLSTGRASVVLEGGDIILAAEGDVRFAAKNGIVARKTVQHNPTLTVKQGAPAGDSGSDPAFAGALPLTKDATWADLQVPRDTSGQ